MSGIVKVNKEQLSTISSTIKSKITTLGTLTDETSGSIGIIPAHKDFSSLTTKALKISKSIESIYKDLEKVSNNIDSYINTLITIDSESFDVTAPEVATASYLTGSETGWASSSGATSLISSTSYSVGQKKFTSSTSGTNSSNTGNYTYSYSSGPNGTVVHTSSQTGKVSQDSIAKMENSLESKNGTTIMIPAGLGTVHTYMGWQCIKAKTSPQYKLKEAAGMNFDEEGFGKIGDRYVVATTTTYGQVGDFIDVYKEDGTVIKCIIGDIKNQADAGCNQWGHLNGQCVIEFIVDKDSWYSDRMHANPGTESCHPEWNQATTKIVNNGNFFDMLQNNNAEQVMI